jgi:AcrR family transcriptional regulator
MRRIPRQQRGQKRVNAILEAGSALIAEEGLEAVTTNAIAERAGTSIGSLYQFFPNKDSIIEAIAQAVAEELHAERLLLPYPPTPVLAVRQHLDWLSQFLGRHPTLLPLLQMGYHTAHHQLIEGHIHAELARQYVDIVLHYFPQRDREITQRQAAIAVRSIAAIFNYAARQDIDGKTQIVTELKTMLVRYLCDLHDLTSNS